jgi:protein ImuB
MFACLYRPPAADCHDRCVDALVAVAREFSPRYESSGDALVTIDISGLDRLVGPPSAIGEALRREAATRGVPVHVAIAPTRSAAMVIALARRGLTIVDPGREREALATVPVEILEHARGLGPVAQSLEPSALRLEPFKSWGIRTLGELAALPPAELAARLGQPALVWRAVARGEDTAPLVPTIADERFESTIDLEWPVEGLEPLSFVLTRLLEPLAARLEQRDRGAANLHLTLRLVTKDEYARHLQLTSPLRDGRTLRTLLLLDLESHPPPAGIDRVTLVIDPTPGRVIQHTLFARAHPTPEQLSTLLARLGALMGQERIGVPVVVDSYRPGAFVMAPFATDQSTVDNRQSTVDSRQSTVPGPQPLASALRRCRHPVPARAVVEEGRPIRLTSDRRGFAGGSVLAAAGPWRTSGEWWGGAINSRQSTVDSPQSTVDSRPSPAPWDRDEWDVALADGGVYRVFRDRETGGWFIDGIVD